MKKFRLLLLAAVLTAGASAFTNVETKRDGQWYRAVYSGSDLIWELIEGEVGGCNEENQSVFCKGFFEEQPAPNTEPPLPQLKGDYIPPTP